MTRREVLIIEDNQDLRDTIANILRKRGFTCETANSGEEGIKKITDSIALVFSDLRMDNLGGFDVLKYARKNYPDLKVIIMTGEDDFENIKKEGIKKGAYDVIKKPFNRDYLLKEVKDALGQ